MEQSPIFIRDMKKIGVRKRNNTYFLKNQLEKSEREKYVIPINLIILRKIGGERILQSDFWIIAMKSRKFFCEEELKKKTN